jgi:hypothetical protein
MGGGKLETSMRFAWFVLLLLFLFCFLRACFCVVSVGTICVRFALWSALCVRGGARGSQPPCFCVWRLCVTIFLSFGGAERLFFGVFYGVSHCLFVVSCDFVIFEKVYMPVLTIGKLMVEMFFVA